MRSAALTRYLASMLIAIATLISGVGTASAGSAAYTLSDVSLRLGPGAKYKIVSDMPEGVEVDVERCSRRWCLIDSRGNRGWASMDHLTFGTEMLGPLEGPKMDRVSHGTGTICFHTGANYTGESICSKTGVVVSDLALHGYDNVFASVSVEGEISAHVCREFNFASYCETINESQPQLSRFLHRSVSSYRVW